MKPALDKYALQKLATLQALSLWGPRGAYGEVRLQKVLFFAERDNDPSWRFFTFKKYFLGQYSDEVSVSINALASANAIRMAMDGPAMRFISVASSRWRAAIDGFFSDYFSTWHEALARAHREWAYLGNDAILMRAHDDESYTARSFNEVIFEGFPEPLVEFEDLDDEFAESLHDLVDERLHAELATRLTKAAGRPVESNWRTLFE